MLPCETRFIPYKLPLYEDDLVLFSESSKGLQNALNKLNEYCRKWKFTVNLNRTKVVIFNKGGSRLKSITSSWLTQKLKLHRTIAISVSNFLPMEPSTWLYED